MKKLSVSIAGIVLFSLFLILGTSDSRATLRYKKQTGKKCTYCHTGIPEPGDEDPQLNKEGKKFKENDYRLDE